MTVSSKEEKNHVCVLGLIRGDLEKSNVGLHWFRARFCVQRITSQFLIFHVDVVGWLIGTSWKALDISDAAPGKCFGLHRTVTHGKTNTGLSKCSFTRNLFYEWVWPFLATSKMFGVLILCSQHSCGSKC